MADRGGLAASAPGPRVAGAPTGGPDTVASFADFSELDTYILKQAAAGRSLDTLRRDFTTQLNEIKTSLIDLIHRDYTGLLTLASDLSSLTPVVQASRAPLDDLATELATTRDQLLASYYCLAAVILRRARLVHVRSRLEAFGRLVETINQAERLTEQDAVQSCVALESAASSLNQIYFYESLAAEATDPLARLASAGADPAVGVLSPGLAATGPTSGMVGATPAALAGAPGPGGAGPGPGSGAGSGGTGKDPEASAGAGGHPRRCGFQALIAPSLQPGTSEGSGSAFVRGFVAMVAGADPLCLRPIPLALPAGLPAEQLLAACAATAAAAAAAASTADDTSAPAGGTVADLAPPGTAALPPVQAVRFISTQLEQALPQLRERIERLSLVLRERLESAFLLLLDQIRGAGPGAEQPGPLASSLSSSSSSPPSSSASSVAGAAAAAGLGSMANEPGAISHEDQLLSFLRTYDCLGLAGYAEQLCRTHLYEPLIAREFEQYNRQLPMLFDHAGASTDAGGAARQEQLELRLTEQLYASLAKVVQHDPCGLITVARASRLEFDFFSNSFWPALSGSIANHMKMAFQPGRPDLFHAHYRLFCQFTEQIRQANALHMVLGEGGSPVLAPVPSAAGPICQSEMLLHNRLRQQLMPVYYQIRFRELAAPIDELLTSPVTMYPLLVQKAALSLQRAWSPEVILPPIVHRMCKFSLQLVAQVSGAFTPAKVALNVTPAPGGAGAGATDAFPEGVFDLLDILACAEYFQQAVHRVVGSDMQTQLPDVVGASSLLRDAFADALDPFETFSRSAAALLASAVADSLLGVSGPDARTLTVQALAEVQAFRGRYVFLEPGAGTHAVDGGCPCPGGPDAAGSLPSRLASDIRAISARYRMTSLGLPGAPSPHLVALFGRLDTLQATYAERLRGHFPAPVLATFLPGEGTGLPAAVRMHLAAQLTWHFAVATRQLLDLVRKTAASLERLQKRAPSAPGAGVAGTGTGPGGHHSDEDKIRRQVALDLEFFAAGVHRVLAIEPAGSSPATGGPVCPAFGRRLGELFAALQREVADSPR
ncbi:hypothetical protein H696_02132 [Fonticula alba]|uniref:COG complex component COG2 C-terminal domain-containing protein n=1 Tax=Fonticula alba TaxID=691883 RepID=A0A058ZA92_FONAL|nr:hypothetical protein H696_02132 [Fonticula alba]KCV71180.1 hypothetical protein H696_02132 [Fonticula alba]|eukprot:XP_009494303.1 hypothetical protein H696_02132 [Fonticula alba]